MILVSDDELAVCLRQTYGVSAVRLERLRLGLDAEAAVFRVEAADGRAYFLKLRSGAPAAASLVVPRFLRDAGISQVVAPLPTRTGVAWGSVGGLSAILYPFIPGRSGFAGGLTLAQWSELGAALRRMHALVIPSSLARLLPRERFVPARRWTDAVTAVLAGDHVQKRPDEVSRRVGDFLAERLPETRALLDRTLALGRRLQRRPVQRVLCHADIHVGNVLLADDGAVHLVDWDQPVLAPRECDLMLLFGPAIRGFVEGSPEEDAFRAGDGALESDPLAMAYYSHERVITDIGAFAYEVFWLPDADDAAHQAAARSLERLFMPGGSVEAAYRADARLLT